MLNQEFEQEMEKLRHEHQERLRKVIRNRIQALQEEIHGYADPKAALAAIHLLHQSEIQLEQSPVSGLLTPEQELLALDRTEEWYKTRDLPYPQPEWLKEQRAFWKNQIQPPSKLAGRPL